MKKRRTISGFGIMRASLPFLSSFPAFPPLCLIWVMSCSELTPKHTYAGTSAPPTPMPVLAPSYSISTPSSRPPPRRLAASHAHPQAPVPFFSTDTHPAPAPATAEALEKKEAIYAAAWERTFGGEEGNGSGNGNGA
ncbi:hypothetical protein C8R45DRAFT_1106188 [Mycena sanguinolenta]|nr:hypothetical protein C8R45DRAFT_1106188 [Mycena sanguinolenta]